MRNFRFFPTRKEYRDFIYGEIVTSPLFHNHPFYRGLTEWVIDHVTPIFFDSSAEYEHAHFSQYYNATLIRPTYTNRVIEDLYFLHDFFHQTLWRPLKPRSVSLKFFTNLSIENEYVASNETEIMIYYRIPELRELTFGYPILYDYLVKYRKEKPSAQDMLDFRRAFTTNDFVLEIFFDQDRQHLAPIRKFMQKMSANLAWVALWYAGFPEVRHDWSRSRGCINYDDLDNVLTNYEGDGDEQRYQNNVAQNVALLIEYRYLSTCEIP